MSLSKEIRMMNDMLFDEMNMMLVYIGSDKTCLAANKQALDFAGIRKREALGQVYWDLPWWRHSQEVQNQLIFAVENAFFGEEKRFAATYMNKSNELYDIDFVLKPIFIDGEVKYVIAMGYNITEYVNTMKALTRREKQIQSFFEFSYDGYFFTMLLSSVKFSEIDLQAAELIVDCEVLTSSNKRLSNMLDNQVIKTTNELYKALGFAPSELYDIYYKLLLGEMVRIEKKFESPIYGTKIFEITLASIYSNDHEFEGNFGVVRDITKEKQYVKELTYLANHDQLTGLYNRRHFYNKANFINNPINRDRTYCIGIFDIDHFKKINDTYGHDTGDQVLRILSLNAKNVFDEIGAVVGRFGGEEFIFIAELDEEDGTRYLDRIRRQVQDEVMDYNGEHIRITISGGVSAFTPVIDTIDNIIKNADIALYEAKRTGRNKIVDFSSMKHE